LKIITEWQHIKVLEDVIEQSLIDELRSYFKEIVTEMLSEEDYENYDITEVGKMAVLEVGDAIDNLPEIGFYDETIRLTESISEYVERVEIDEEIYYRILVLLNDAEGVIIYAKANTHGDEFENWVLENERSNL
jgi:hypothetical protein